MAGGALSLESGDLWNYLKVQALPNLKYMLVQLLCTTKGFKFWSL